jgi:hypothetical protein
MVKNKKNVTRGAGGGGSDKRQKSVKYYLNGPLHWLQWFPIGVPRQNRVSWKSVKGAAKYPNYCLFLMFYYLGCSQFYFDQQGAVN